MSSLEKLIDFIKPLTGLIVLVTMAYFFTDITAWFAIAAVLSLIGNPLVDAFCKIHFGKRHLPRSVASLMTIVTFFIVIAAFFLILVPLVARQAAAISNINTNEVMKYFYKPISDFSSWLMSYNIVDSNFDIYTAISDEVSDILNMANIRNIFTSAISAISSFVIGVFAIIFLLFFMLNEPNMLHSIITAVVPDKYETQTNRTLNEAHGLLSRYFIGLLGEVVSMMTLITIFLAILGVRNALLIGFLAGLLNVIPYLGPVIGAVLGCILGLITTVSLQQYGIIIPTILKIAGSVAVANIIDNFVLQPLIYSKSVKAHPVEIFIVTIIAGKIGGIGGLLVAIPSYTIIRVIAKEFFGQLKFVNALTKKKEEG